MADRPLRFEFRRGGGFRKAAVGLLATTTTIGVLLFLITKNSSWPILFACLSVSILYFLHKKTKVTVFWTPHDPQKIDWDTFELAPDWKTFTFHFDIVPANWWLFMPAHGRLRLFKQHGNKSLLIEQNLPIKSLEVFKDASKSPEFDLQTTWHYLAFGNNLLKLINRTQPDFWDNSADVSRFG